MQPVLPHTKATRKWHCASPSPDTEMVLPGLKGASRPVSGPAGMPTSCMRVGRACRTWAAGGCHGRVGAGSQRAADYGQRWHGISDDRHHPAGSQNQAVPAPADPGPYGGHGGAQGTGHDLPGPGYRGSAWGKCPGAGCLHQPALQPLRQHRQDQPAPAGRLCVSSVRSGSQCRPQCGSKHCGETPFLCGPRDRGRCAVRGILDGDLTNPGTESAVVCGLG